MIEAIKDYVGALQGIYRITQDPEQTDAVFQIARGLQRSGVFPRLAARTRSLSPEIDRLITERYRPPVANLDELGKLPPGTLGREFSEHMRRHNFAVEFYPKVTVIDDGTYLLLRLRQTHDIWHTVTGFSTDPAGELGLQAFLFAQLYTPLSVVLIATGFVRTLFWPQGRRRLVKEVRRGYELGKACRPLLAQRWEERWDRPLAEWRAELGIPCPA